MLHLLSTEASADTSDDLFWAMRGGGGGSFGIATQFVFDLDPLEHLQHISIHRSLEKRDAARILYDWQNWSVRQARYISTHLRLLNYGRGNMLVSLTGHSMSTRRDTLSAGRSIIAFSVLALKRPSVRGRVPRWPFSS